ncbi:hypothetical protein [Aeoliella sp.]|uniref:hypothetical protein n=1 Tax=Aeoliella sp. TaxID=2795800 RepID=UPI003CCBBD86
MRNSPVLCRLKFFASGLAVICGLAFLPCQRSVAFQLVVLDFDTFTDGTSDDGKDHVYTPAERDAIVTILNEKFAPYPVAFTDVEPTTGLFSKVYFNSGLAGAGDVDFQNKKKIDDASIHIPKLLETATLTAPFDSTTEIIPASVNIAAHETLHLLGTRHHDSYLPIGTGVPSTFVGSGYVPVFPGPAAAMLSSKEFNSLTTSIGFSAAKLLDPDLFIGPRSAVKLLHEEFLDLDVDSADANLATDPQPLELKTIPIPNPLPGDPVFGDAEFFADVVIVEEASIEVADGTTEGVESDYYEFYAEAGDIMHIEVMSDILDFRLSPTFDAMVALLDPAAALAPVPWFTGSAVSFDERETDSDAFLWDVTIPAPGTYVIEVTHDFVPSLSDGRKYGEYEMLVYRLRAHRVPEPGTAGLLVLFSCLVMGRVYRKF